MACTNCGEGAVVEEYALRFERGGDRSKRIRLQLCDPCLEDICSETGIEQLERGIADRSS